MGRVAIVADRRWLAFIQPAYWDCIIWQFAQAAGSLVRYDPPRA